MIDKIEPTPAKRREISGWHHLDFLFNHLLIVAIFASLAGAGSIGFAIWKVGHEIGVKQEWPIRLISACWTVLPAVYFFFEFHWARATQSARVFRRVKESQKMAQKVWAGVVVALAVIYLKA